MYLSILKNPERENMFISDSGHSCIRLSEFHKKGYLVGQKIDFEFFAPPPLPSSF